MTAWRRRYSIVRKKRKKRKTLEEIISERFFRDH